jgi:hypothetical protein
MVRLINFLNVRLLPYIGLLKFLTKDKIECFDRFFCKEFFLNKKENKIIFKLLKTY